MSATKAPDTLFKLVHSLKRNVQESIENLDLGIAPMNVRVLKIIAHKPHCTAIDIANALDRDKAQVTRLLSTLINADLVAKEPNPVDKRSQCLRVTEGGQAILGKISGIDKKMWQQMTSDVSEEEMKVFQNVLEKMVTNLTAK
ncbi:MarR family winged helix-turn-helix transcriptional regulator [Enterovibrio sp. ZSDZ35]|uniref:MarR family winged helix-turn-helix transcriptional regulator n=1 Tax=Enterovibrio qingdaonensis TaxID=2899818 RepID=A0ABT5QNJ1_9GAMM|nr:MarR family winged helix-turn-helix transcriptional regulator [Enterovibrio sp. ZSDZ35]MDD1782558.1 MarR family winged helix-turn-helix transcriptional regulator [Enterovibrio sp. ZSDZ35]